MHQRQYKAMGILWIHSGFYHLVDNKSFYVTFSVPLWKIGGHLKHQYQYIICASNGRTGNLLISTFLCSIQTVLCSYCRKRWCQCSVVFCFLSYSLRHPWIVCWARLRKHCIFHESAGVTDWVCYTHTIVKVFITDIITYFCIHFHKEGMPTLLLLDIIHIYIFDNTFWSFY